MIKVERTRFENLPPGCNISMSIQYSNGHGNNTAWFADSHPPAPDLTLHNQDLVVHPAAAVLFPVIGPAGSAVMLHSLNLVAVQGVVDIRITDASGTVIRRKIWSFLPNAADGLNGLVVALPA